LRGEVLKPRDCLHQDLQDNLIQDLIRDSYDPAQ